MSPVPNIHVVIAAYNEASVIARNIAQVRAFVSNIVVVDDCSSDETAQEAQRAGAHVLCHPVNLGQGAALQTGIEYAVAQGADYIVTFDADGQHQPQEILPMVQALQASGAQVALGSRFLGSTINMAAKRRLLLKLAIAFTHLTGGGKFSDAHNGFRVLTRAFAQKFEFRQNRMAHASEIQSYIARKKVPYIEFPVTIAYTEYSVHKGQKGSNAVRVLIELFVDWIT